MDNREVDSRMNWILHIEEVNSSKTKSAYYTEYEICSEVRITGQLNYKDDSIRCQLLEEKNAKGLYTYQLTVKHIEKEYKFNRNNYSNEGYYFEEGLVGELLAIFSVFFQCRFYLKTSCTNSGFRYRYKFTYSQPEKLINYEMFTNQNRNWCNQNNNLEDFLNKIISLNQKYHQKLINSFFWYAEGIKELGINSQLFFIKMTSCIEPLLKFTPNKKSNDLERKVTNLIRKSIFNNSETEELENWLKNRNIKKRFVNFIAKYSKGFFKSGRRKRKNSHIYKSKLNEFTKIIYNARSKFLHEGTPMYLSMEPNIDSEKHVDIDGTLGMMSDRKKFNTKEKLPRPRWFERIVNHCLQNFIEEKRLIR
ncbi:hypothetical protein KA119_02765 [Candidatus Gracilibacteria bacterium]|nr:hypothetical protein [Candidatus Gracilibacteria bacterium]